LILNKIHPQASAGKRRNPVIPDLKNQDYREFFSAFFLTLKEKFMPKEIIVTGSGIGGIATAIRLAVLGYNVMVFESDKGPGGKLNTFELDGYRYDLGPSLFTMPQFVDELFILAGRNPSDYFRYIKWPLACRYFWKDGTVLNSYTDRDAFAAEIERVLGADGAKLKAFLRHSNRLYETNAPVFLQTSLHRPQDFKIRDILKALAYMPRMDIFTSMDRANQRRLVHPRLVQMFNRMATYNGSNPYKAPGILNIIPSLEHGTGVFFPEGGMYSITSALYKLALELGVEFHFNEPVEEILLYREKAIGVRTSLGEYTSDAVVSNMDVVLTFRKLLKNVGVPAYLLRQERSSSALVFYWGIKKVLPELDLHNIFFSDNYPEEFDCLFNKLSIYDDPTVYINISSRVNEADAPENHDNWFVMVNAPHEAGQDWADLVSRTRKNITSKLSVVLGTDIQALISSEYVLTPPEIETRTSSWQGSLYGASSNSRMAAFLRHPNFSGRVKGLYFAGGSVHPGGGIPLCLSSAKITAGIIAKQV
jgi:phytoene desaturase